MRAPITSPSTFTVVRNVSMRRSIGIKMATYSTGRFRALSTMAKVTIPALGIAGAPIEAAMAKKTKKIWSYKPRFTPTILATNNATAAS